MKTVYIIPCALLAAAIALGAPSASTSASAKSFQAKFAYDRADAAEQVYAD